MSRVISAVSVMKIGMAVAIALGSFAGVSQARDRHSGSSISSGFADGDIESRTFRKRIQRQPGRQHTLNRRNTGVERRHSDRYIAHQNENRRIAIRTTRERNGERYDGGWNNGGDRFPSFIPGGAYAGSISAWRDRGNGNYFNLERYGYDDGGGNSGVVVGPRAKIIRVTPGTHRQSCSMEAGVCVIRR